jgi:DeoR/GlpR family transcriptional regulator of sugar metabolism
LVEEKRSIISISTKVILLADHTKFEQRSLCQAIPIEEIDVVVTDDKTSKEVIKQIEESDVEVIIASTKQDT